jgi:hypothetical protein
MVSMAISLVKMKSTKTIFNSGSRRNRKLGFSRLFLSLILILVATPLLAQEWAPSEQFLNLVRRIESADGLMLIGDHGNSRGAYQMSAGAWNDVSEWRRARNLRSYDYSTMIWNESISRDYASNYLQMLHDRLARSMARSPSCGEVYAAYNMGFTAFAHCRFSLAHVNSTTAGNCRFIDHSIADTETVQNRQNTVTLASK